MSVFRTFALRATRSAGFRLTRLSGRLEAPAVAADGSAGTELTLVGERDIEWAWSLARLSPTPGRVLDFGAGNGLLSLAAAFRRHDVVAVDLEPSQFLFRGSAIEYRRGDFNEMLFEPESFDQIINCSSIEHAGISGRYGSPEDEDGDLRAMDKMASLLRPGGSMILSIPVGLDAVYRPWHRVYGESRLPELLRSYSTRDEQYWAKLDVDLWEPVERDRALSQEGSPSYYALGLYVVEPR